MIVVFVPIMDWFMLCCVGMSSDCGVCSNHRLVYVVWCWNVK